MLAFGQNGWSPKAENPYPLLKHKLMDTRQSAVSGYKNSRIRISLLIADKVGGTTHEQ